MKKKSLFIGLIFIIISAVSVPMIFASRDSRLAIYDDIEIKHYYYNYYSIAHLVDDLTEEEVFELITKMFDYQEQNNIDRVLSVNEISELVDEVKKNDVNEEEGFLCWLLGHNRESRDFASVSHLVTGPRHGEDCFYHVTYVYYCSRCGEEFDRIREGPFNGCSAR